MGEEEPGWAQGPGAPAVAQEVVSAYLLRDDDGRFRFDLEEDDLGVVIKVIGSSSAVDDRFKLRVGDRLHSVDSSPTFGVDLLTARGRVKAAGPMVLIRVVRDPERGAPKPRGEDLGREGSFAAAAAIGEARALMSAPRARDLADPWAHPPGGERVNGLLTSTGLDGAVRRLSTLGQRGAEHASSLTADMADWLDRASRSDEARRIADGLHTAARTVATSAEQARLRLSTSVVSAVGGEAPGDRMPQDAKEGNALATQCFCDVRGYACPAHPGREAWRARQDYAQAVAQGERIGFADGPECPAPSRQQPPADLLMD